MAFFMFYTFVVFYANYYNIVFRNPQDIDLVTGALSEAPIEGAALGPTFQCLLGRTFHNLRLGKIIPH